MKMKSLRRILILLIAAVLLFLVIHTGFDWWAGRRIDAEVARLEQRYGSLDPQTLTVPSVPEGENRARAIRAAAALIKYTPRESWSEYQPSLSAFSKQNPPAPVPADLRAFVETNRSTLRLVADARSRPQSNWEADYSGRGNVPRLLEIRTLSNTIYLASLLDLEAGRPDKAAQSIASGLAMAASMRQEPWLITQLIRIAVTGQHMEAVQRLLVWSEPSKASLEELAKWLVENRSPDPMHVGLLGELKLFNGSFTRAESTAELPTLLGIHPPFVFGPPARLTRPLARLSRLRYLQMMGELLDAQTGARPRPGSMKAPSRWSSPVKEVVYVAKPGLERAMDSGDQFNSALGLTELAVALRRFRLEHGQYPDALSALAPTYLPSVPIDPQTGKPSAYERLSAGFRLQAAQDKIVSAQTAALRDWTVPK